MEIFEAAARGNLEPLPEILKKDDLILDKFVMGYSNVPCPLHVAVSKNHIKFVTALLEHKPELIQVLDSEQQSALHVASAKGHVAIVRLLLKQRPQMCLALDRNGHNALHVAALNGKDEVLKELIKESPHAARVRVGCGGTILHLCVKYKQLSTLEKLMDMINDEDFINSKDNDGNTILHLAVSGKQLEVVKYVLKNKKFDVNARNTIGRTAMDILFLEKTKKGSRELSDFKDIEDFLRKAKVIKAERLIHGEWLSKKRDSLMVVASLIATMAFQVAMNPPGGVWQDNLNPDGVWPEKLNGTYWHRAGEAVMAYNYPNSYPYFLRLCTIGFVASLSTILLLVSGLPFWKRSLTWIVIATMWIAITSMAFAFAFAIVVVTPKCDRESLSRTIVIAVLVWCSVMVLLLLVHVVHFFVNVFEEKRYRNKANERIISRANSSKIRPNEGINEGISRANSFKNRATV